MGAAAVRLAGRAGRGAGCGAAGPALAQRDYKSFNEQRGAEFSLFSGLSASSSSASPSFGWSAGWHPSARIAIEGSGSWVFSAKASIDEVRERLGVEIEPEGFETVGDWREAHERFWSDREIGDDTLVVAERFRLIERLEFPPDGDRA